MTSGENPERQLSELDLRLMEGKRLFLLQWGEVEEVHPMLREVVERDLPALIAELRRLRLRLEEEAPPES